MSILVYDISFASATANVTINILSMLLVKILSRNKIAKYMTNALDAMVNIYSVIYCLRIHDFDHSLHVVKS